MKEVEQKAVLGVSAGVCSRRLTSPHVGEVNDMKRGREHKSHISDQGSSCLES